MGRPKKKGARIGNRLSRALAAIMDRNPPAQHILDRRGRFSFLVSKGGATDRDTCDGIGQLQVLGLLDGYEADTTAMVSAGREYTEMRRMRYNITDTKIGSAERSSRSSSSFDGETSRDRKYDRMDDAISSADKDWLLTLTETSDEVVPWALALINEALLKRGIVAKFAKFPTCEDRARLASVCRGLCALAGGALPERRRLAA